MPGDTAVDDGGTSAKSEKQKKQDTEMEYNFREIEKKWHEKWVKDNTYKVTEDKEKKKFYVLNMFPYPSGAGLHVGHPLGYIASDIYARYKRQGGYNVLNPMGYDAYAYRKEPKRRSNSQNRLFACGLLFFRARW